MTISRSGRSAKGQGPVDYMYRGRGRVGLRRHPRALAIVTEQEDLDVRDVASAAGAHIVVSDRNRRIFVLEPANPSLKADSLRAKLRRNPQIQAIGYIYGQPNADPSELDDWLIPTDEIVAVISDPDEEALAKHGLSVERRIDYVPNGLVLRIHPDSGLDSLDKANRLVEDGLAEQAEPNWIRKIDKRVPAKMRTGVKRKLSRDPRK